ncbi:hypothetical protein CVT24_006036 [Panaeolus cyanescens]|uniref:F-box domain-containing protein n=1 Tax=Panaeolus cyanescens TaxID=181874 RepID=A0A409YE44_9AGAR|nr:hypothetical protein CVT24_006036 [Panaeolus cyanescens]
MCTSPTTTKDHHIPAQPSLNGVSLDILLEIMSYLEWHELLVLRKVCTGLNRASRERVLWRNLITSSPSRFTLTKRIQRCSSQELEDAFLRVQRAQHNWTNPRFITPHVRPRPGLGNIHSCRNNYVLLPGGRWLLKLEWQRTFTVFYADLNSGETNTWRTLIHLQSETNPASFLYRTRMSQLLDIDQSSECLAFNFLTLTDMPGEETKEFLPTRFDVWRCTSEYDTDDCEIGLQASLLSSFQETHAELNSFKASLTGDFVTYEVIYDSYFRQVVVDWKLANGQIERLPRYVFPQQYEDDEQTWFLLPRNRLFRLTSFQWDVFSWDQMLPSTDASGFDLSGLEATDSGLVASCTSPSASGRYDHIFVRNDTVHIINVLLDQTTRFYFQLPISDSPSPLTVTSAVLYGSLSESTFFDFSENRALFRYSSNRFSFVKYHRDHEEKEDSSIETFNWEHDMPFHAVSDVAFDDISSRCLFTSPDDQHYTVDL